MTQISFEKLDNLRIRITTCPIIVIYFYSVLISRSSYQFTTRLSSTIHFYFLQQTHPNLCNKFNHSFHLFQRVCNIPYYGWQHRKQLLERNPYITKIFYLFFLFSVVFVVVLTIQMFRLEVAKCSTIMIIIKTKLCINERKKQKPFQL